MRHDMRTQRAEEKDAEILSIINNECYPFLDLEEPSYFKWIIREGIGKVLVCVVDDEIVGFVHYDVVDEKRAVILRMGVREDYRGMGVGTLLLSEVENGVKGVEEVYAYVAERNWFAQEWFKRRGYSRLSKPEVYTGWVAYDDVVDIIELKRADWDYLLMNIRRKLLWWYPDVKRYISKLINAPGVVCLDQDLEVLAHFILRDWYVTVEYVAYSPKLSRDLVERKLVMMTNAVANEHGIDYCEAPVRYDSVDNTWKYLWLEYPFIKKLRKHVN
ncbi:MAG: hypothetical protein DRN15_08955 [Thermoprotei archaeon]|nr:MAG: hypothetical protein DRN15_08955 [Thermoprotei archaeon]RLF22895.1 MAG: hypothetical protein DRM97_05275 [Thermoprotei archaeon]